MNISKNLYIYKNKHNNILIILIKLAREEGGRDVE